MNKNTRNTTADYMREAINKGEINNLQIKVNTTANRLLITNDNLIGGVSVLSNGKSEIYYVKYSVVLAARVI